ATGAFSGAAFESDTYSRINWLGGSPDLRITSIDWSSNNPYICDPVTATVHVQNNSTTSITTPFRVDLYKNRSTAPPAGTLGDSYITISSLAAGVTTNVTFTNLSTVSPGTWTSWFQVDANNLITESNESNNVWSPAISTTWYALPVVSNLQAVKSGSNIQLSWSYPISVYRYKIYKDTNPYGSFSTLAGTSDTSSFSQALSATKLFYRVQAERILP
ncbi:MAG: CARDB domain-containing protein, partial [Candidatus Cloacimonas sp.]|nr:CARDB domain-containing protein [Candidatus Cloacimonas sp.]